MLARVRQAVVLDTVARARRARAVEQIIVVTDSPELACQARALGAIADLDPEREDFHFGRRLAGLVRRHRLRRIFYMSGGLGALATSDDLAWVARELSRRDAVVICNNIHSSDLVAFTPGSVIWRVEPPAMDNSLAMTLAQEGGLPVLHPPRTLGLHFDIDTPADVAIASVHPGLGEHTRRLVDGLPLGRERVWQVFRVMGDPHADLLVFGRIGAPLFYYLDDRTRCRLRVLSEERGMKSLGRDVRGEVVSLMGHLWECAGSTGLFRVVAKVARAAVLDSRVLFAHRRWSVSPEDRFLSDLGHWERIGHPGVREFTRAAMEAEVPVLLGGHSLVSGGIWALVDAALRGVRAP